MLFLPTRNRDYFSSISEMFCNKRFFWSDVKQFLFRKGLKSNAALTINLHLMGLSPIETSTVIDLVLLLGRYYI